MCIRDSGKPTSFTVDTGATVSIVRPDLVCNRHPLISSCTIQTVTGSPVKVLGKVDVRVRPVSYTHLDVYKRQEQIHMLRCHHAIMSYSVLLSGTHNLAKLPTSAQLAN